jgi:ubiquinone/menaquinone biosynthesis C-methylase UbiE
MKETFKDYFSQQAKLYARYRPEYPREVFEYISSLSKKKDVALDCATGNGQAANGLAGLFTKVVAVDASAQQLSEATHHPRITYLVSPAEHLPVRSGAVNLVTVAQAVHWFSFDEFYREVCRVAAKDGIIAVWCYGFLRTTSELDELLVQYRDNIVGNFWSPERKYVDENYATIPFPFEELKTPKFSMRKQWNLEQLIGYLNSWSSTRLYAEKNNRLPTELIRKDLERTWGDPDSPKIVDWDVHLRVGKVHS